MPYKPIIWVVPMIAIISLVGFVADGFVGFVGGRWSVVLGLWVLLMSLLC